MTAFEQPENPDARSNGTPARIVALKLTDFRNYASLSLPLDGRSVVFTGPNGAGKTNLLEAVSFLSPGSGLRRAPLDAIGRRPGAGTWAVAARVENGGGTADIGTGVTASPEGLETRRTVRVNRTPARSSEALLEYLRVIWLTPGMDGLFTGPASDRRRFLDRAVLAIDRQHGTRFNAFEKAMRGRNRLLAEPGPDPAWLDAIESEMAELGVAIAAARREWAGVALAMIRSTPPSPFPAADIALEGSLELGLADETSGAVEDRYRMLLAAERGHDAAAGRTLIGPHRSDLLVRHAPKDIEAATCSTGEQKALLIGLILAQARLVGRMTGETPIILLDEVAAHLDTSRREALFSVLDELGAQALMTGTDRSMFAAMGHRAERFEVRDGTVQPTPAGND